MNEVNKHNCYSYDDFTKAVAAKLGEDCKNVIEKNSDILNSVFENIAKNDGGSNDNLYEGNSFEFDKLVAETSQEIVSKGNKLLKWYENLKNIRSKNLELLKNVPKNYESLAILAVEDLKKPEKSEKPEKSTNIINDLIPMEKIL